MVPEGDINSCYQYHTTPKVSETQAFTIGYLIVKEILGATVSATQGRGQVTMPPPIDIYMWVQKLTRFWVSTRSPLLLS